MNVRTPLHQKPSIADSHLSLRTLKFAGVRWTVPVRPVTKLYSLQFRTWRTVPFKYTIVGFCQFSRAMWHSPSPADDSDRRPETESRDESEHFTLADQIVNSSLTNSSIFSSSLNSSVFTDNESGFSPRSEILETPLSIGTLVSRETRMLYNESDHSGLESEEEDFPFSDGIDTFSFIRPINRPLQRSYIKPTENVNVCDGLKRYWVLFDKEIMLKTHIELLNIDLTKTSHARVSLLAHDSGVVTREEAKRRIAHGIGEELRSANSASTLKDIETPISGYWAHFLPVTEINALWTSIVANIYFFGDKFSNVVTIQVIDDTESLLQLQTKGFDSVYQNSQRGGRSNQGLRCCVFIPCNGTCDAEIYRHGASLLSTLPEDKRKADIYFRHLPQHDSKSLPHHRNTKEKSSHKSIRKMLKTSEEHVDASIYKLARRAASKPTPLFGRDLTNEMHCQRRRKKSRTEEEDPVLMQFLLMKLDGIAWKIISPQVMLSSS